eukprot:5041627-Amphidinium_carterae.2
MISLVYPRSTILVSLRRAAVVVQLACYAWTLAPRLSIVIRTANPFHDAGRKGIDHTKQACLKRGSSYGPPKRSSLSMLRERTC